MSLPAAAVSRRAAYDQDDDAPPDYHEPEAQQKPPEYRYPLSHKLLWWAFVAAILGFFVTSVATVVTRLEAVEAARHLFLGLSGSLEAPGAVKQDEFGRVYDWEGGGSKGLWMNYLPKNFVDDISDLHLATNVLTVGASGMVLLEFLARCGCIGSRIPSFLHRLIISLIAAAAGLTIATQAYAARQLAASSTFDLEVARTISKTKPSTSEYLVEIEYSEGRFALESWACQLKDFKTLWDTPPRNQFDRNNRFRDVCIMSRTWRHWSIAAGVLAVVLLVVLVVDWRFQFFVKRKAKEKKTPEGDGIHIQALQPNASTEARPRPALPY